MEDVRKVTGNEIKRFVDLMSNAYPLRVPRTTENMAAVGFQLLERMAYDASQSVHGLYRDGEMLGGMIIYDFMLTYRQGRMAIGGVGSIAVDLLHKKERVCKAMIRYFLAQARRKKQSMVALYPFRPDFYKRMGFGFGGKYSEYNVDPLAFAQTGRKACRMLSLADAEEVAACYNRCAKKRHGMLARTAGAFELLFNNPAYRVVGYDDGTGLKGFLNFQFQPRKDSHFLVYDMVVEELIYEDTAALQGLLHFLRSQADQVKRVILYSQEENFHHLLSDPRDGSNHVMPVLAHASHNSGVGIMYRVVDAARFFRLAAKQSFGGQDCTLSLMLRDDFLPENAAPLVVAFRNGLPSIVSGVEAEVELHIDVAEFSSLVMGAVDFKTLERYGLAHLSNERYRDVVQRLFATEEKPICSTRF